MRRETKEFAQVLMKATDIPRDGIEIRYQGLKTQISEEYGQFYNIVCEIDGKKTLIAFNSEKLATLLRELNEEIKGKLVKISGIGEEKKREYALEY